MATHPAHFRSLLPIGQRIRYLIWRLAGASRVFRCRLRSGLTISIRPRPSRDYDTAYEIFFLRLYRVELDAATVRYIVDLGGNVGYSVLFWCSNYPRAQVVTVEPHPVHCASLRRHLLDNGYSDRVQLLDAAAGSASGAAFLTDEDDASSVIDHDKGIPGGGLIEVRKIDIFKSIGDRNVDILKMDIEGSEYEILSDSRFETLAARTRCIIIEWHQRAAEHLGLDWCRQRLEQSGFQVTAGRSFDEFGILYAIRPIRS